MNAPDQPSPPLHPHAAATPAPARTAKSARVLSLLAQAVLILITAALILAIWLPALVGPSEEKQRRDQQRWRLFF